PPHLSPLSLHDALPIFARIHAIVLEEHTAYRHADISDEAKALSDADSLFKIMPLSPVLFASKFITEAKVDLHSWATRIIREQKRSEEHTSELQSQSNLV